MRARRQHTRTRSDRVGFTLIEIMLVITIIGLIAATVTIRLSSLTRGARFEWAIGHAMSLDASARVYAKTHDRPVALQFELGTNQLQRAFGKSQADRRELSLGDSVTIRRLVSQAKDSSSGKATVDYSREGRSQTYAIEIVGHGKSAQSVWLLFVGATGQVERQESEFEVVRLSKATKAGNDAG